jgi:DNA-binding transcriptional ArsR family regulator
MSPALGATLAALQDDTRRGVVEALSANTMSAGELAAALDVTPALLTRHLRVLRNAGMVRVALDATDQRKHVYELEPAPLQELRDWADDVASFWTNQLEAFTKHAAETARSSRRRARSHRRAQG